MVAGSSVPATEEACDVIVVGGGPAGSTIAALLAEQGLRTVLVEKDRHPRFHIGESLLPLNLPLLDRLGVREEVDRIGMPKYGVEFVSSYHNKAVTFDFAQSWDKRFNYAYQVRRSEFDHILFGNAAKKGAITVEGCRIVEVAFPANGGVVSTGRGEDGLTRRWHARFLVDASGRETLLANHFKWKERNRKHSSAAVFGHFTGARRLPGKAEGNISIFWFDYGWFWFIPLSDGSTSVGAVCRPQYLKSRRCDWTTFLWNTIALCPGIKERLVDARIVGEAAATGNYSYRSRRMFGDRFILLGDAYGFVDPIFSAGVYLAMTTAFAGAEVVGTALREPQRAARAVRQFEAKVRRGMDSYVWYMYRMRTPALRTLFMSPRNVFGVKEALLSFLAGDIFRPSPIRLRLLVFRFLYYCAALTRLRANIGAWRARRQDVEHGSVG